MEELKTQRLYTLILIILLITAYITPWVINRPIGLILGAYDLAEWASLHPAAYNTTPILLPSLLLRVHLLYITLFSAIHLRGSIAWLFIGLLCLSQLPPLEFLGQITNVNYQQQFALTLGGVIGAIILFTIHREFISHWLDLIIGLSGIIWVIWGVVSSYELLEPFSIHTHIGFGPLLMISSYTIIAVRAIIKQTR